MTIMIQLSDPVEDSLRKAAKRRHLPPEVLAAQLIEGALMTGGGPSPADALTDDVLPALEETVAKIKTLPRNPANIRPAKGSLKELLENAPQDPNFDLAEWQQQWDSFEQELKELEREDRERDKIGY